jgi:hypothetical protein
LEISSIGSAHRYSYEGCDRLPAYDELAPTLSDKDCRLGANAAEHLSLRRTVGGSPG